MIVPDGPLWKLPFEALVTRDGGRRYADLDYLVRRWSVVYGPSGSVLSTLSARDRGRERSVEAPELVAFANPVRPTGGTAASPS